jgi:glycogen debranching enzyme GlgX
MTQVIDPEAMSATLDVKSSPEHTEYGHWIPADRYLGERGNSFGMQPHETGCNFAVRGGANIQLIDVWVPDPSDPRRPDVRFRLHPSETTSDGATIFTGSLPFQVGDIYTLHALDRNNPDSYKTPLLDPYAKSITRFGYPDHPESPYGCVVMPEVDNSERPGHVHIDPSDRIIYEAHIVDTTKLNPDIPEELRGTYAGFAHPANIEYLKSLGVTTVEIQPIQQSFTEQILVERGVLNHWKYSTAGYHSADESLASDQTPGGPDAEVRGMVDALHTAGFEVVLDVVYNHTAEGAMTYRNDRGELTANPTYSLRGLDNAGYYTDTFWGEDGVEHYRDTTGCGNMIDTAKPAARQLVRDSIVRWYKDIGFDGFRYDLAASVGDDGFYGELLKDPELEGCVHFAEPWDFGERGRVNFTKLGIPEWSDEYRDGVRDFWGKGPKALGRLAYWMAGSFDSKSVVNIIDAHDGQTMLDITTYEGKYNDANREPGNNGTDDNHSYNHGHEGPTDDAEINRRRLKTVRNMAYTLFMSRGTPMFVSGDEVLHTKRGNNNTYCRPITPDEGEPDIHSIPFENLTPEQEAMKHTLAQLAILRKRSTIGEQGVTMGRLKHTPTDEKQDGTTHTDIIDERGVDWFGNDGVRLHGKEGWDTARVMGMYSSGRAGNKPGASYVFYANGNPFSKEEVSLPKTIGSAGKYVLVADSSTGEIDPDGIRVLPETFTMEEGSSMIVEKIASTLPKRQVVPEALPHIEFLDPGQNLVEVDLKTKTVHTVPIVPRPAQPATGLPLAA